MSVVTAGEVNITAQGDVNISGTHLLADNQLQIKAAQNILVSSSQSSHKSDLFEKTKESGLFSSGGFGFSIGSKKQSGPIRSTKFTAK